MKLLNIILSLRIIFFPLLGENGFSPFYDSQCEIAMSNSCCNIGASHASCCFKSNLKCGCYYSKSDKEPLKSIVLPNSNENNTKEFTLLLSLTKIYESSGFNNLSSKYVVPVDLFSLHRNLPLLI